MNNSSGANLISAIYEEEREKLRKERGEPEPEPLTPEQEEERNAWIDEMNRVAEEALREMEEHPELIPEHAYNPRNKNE